VEERREEKEREVAYKITAGLDTRTEKLCERDRWGHVLMLRANYYIDRLRGRLQGSFHLAAGYIISLALRT
jgi:hypothetical protein